MQELGAHEAISMAEKAADKLISGIEKLNAKIDCKPLVEPRSIRDALISDFLTLLASRFAIKPDPTESREQSA